MALIGIKKLNSNDFLFNASRDLTEEELKAEIGAEKFSIKNYRRVHPVQGTLGFLFRNIHENSSIRNQTVVELLRDAIEEQIGNSRGVGYTRKLIIVFDNLDDFSKARVDIFDILCTYLGLSKTKLFGLFAEASFNHATALSKVMMDFYKPKVIEEIAKNMKGDKGFADRKLMAEATGVTNNTPLVAIQQNTTINNNKEESKLPAFNQSIRKADLPRMENEIKQLEAGNLEDFIEADIIEEEKILIEKEK